MQLGKGVLRLINRSKKCWDLSQAQKEVYIGKFTSKLAALRAHADIFQEEIANIIRTLRQTYYAIEGRKRAMSWNTYLSLIFFYDAVDKTSQIIRELDAYPTQMIEQFNNATNL